MYKWLIKEEEISNLKAILKAYIFCSILYIFIDLYIAFALLCLY